MNVFTYGMNRRDMNYNNYALRVFSSWHGYTNLHVSQSLIFTSITGKVTFRIEHQALFAY